MDSYQLVNQWLLFNNLVIGGYGEGGCFMLSYAGASLSFVVSLIVNYLIFSIYSKGYFNNMVGEFRNKEFNWLFFKIILFSSGVLLGFIILQFVAMIYFMVSK